MTGGLVHRAIGFIAVALLTSAALAADLPTGEVGPGVPAFWVRPGYKVTLAATGLRKARFIEFGDGDTLFLSQPNAGRIMRLSNPDENGKYKTIATVISGMKTVHGMQLYKGWLWFTQSGSVHKAELKPDGSAGQCGGHRHRRIARKAATIGGDRSWSMTTASTPPSATTGT